MATEMFLVPQRRGERELINTTAVGSSAANTVPDKKWIGNLYTCAHCGGSLICEEMIDNVLMDSGRKGIKEGVELDFSMVKEL